MASTQLTDQAAPPSNDGSLCRVLALDGGGAKGFYTIGVLKELEALVGSPLCDRFSLIFGTSTGAIIAALLALGYSVDEIHALYKEHVPSIMRRWTRKGRSAALAALASDVFGTRTFSDVKTGVGIVATHWKHEKPMIFKSSGEQAHGRQSTFEPGFGCTIADAIRASCSAFPFFERTTLTTSKGNHVELFDGGYCANNPTLYAIADALVALEREPKDVRVVSLGVGIYPEPSKWTSWLARHFMPLQLLQKTLNVNTQSMDELRNILFRNVPTVRVNDTFAHPEMATDLMEHNLVKLDGLYQRGGESFAKHEAALRDFMGVPQRSVRTS